MTYISTLPTPRFDKVHVILDSPLNVTYITVNLCLSLSPSWVFPPINSESSLLVFHHDIFATGAVPGLCFAKELRQGTEYVLFLEKRDGTPTVYEMTEVPDPRTELAKFLAVCDLHVTYPAGTERMSISPLVLRDERPSHLFFERRTSISPLVLRDERPSHTLC